MLQSRLVRTSAVCTGSCVTQMVILALLWYGTFPGDPSEFGSMFCVAVTFPISYQVHSFDPNSTFESRGCPISHWMVSIACQKRQICGVQYHYVLEYLLEVWRLSLKTMLPMLIGWRHLMPFPLWWPVWQWHQHWATHFHLCVSAASVEVKIGNGSM